MLIDFLDLFLRNLFYFLYLLFILLQILGFLNFRLIVMKLRRVNNNRFRQYLLVKSYISVLILNMAFSDKVSSCIKIIRFYCFIDQVIITRLDDLLYLSLFLSLLFLIVSVLFQSLIAFYFCLFFLF